MGWLVDGSEQIDIATKPVFVTPLKEGSKRMMLLQNDMDGDSGEDGGYLKDGSNELGSGEGSWKTSKLLAPTPMRGENLGQDMPKEDMERIVIIEKPISSWSHKSHNRLWHGYKMARNGKAACPNCDEANMA
ncbi:uncharacterized protein LOC134678717 [Cydia fagiglandana]|uniref:uncharacterized protein LOC134678717 n=1 Tax=Cydia fagiglandana TaxID=1458189 RepID=UPI002FEE2A94